MVSPAFFPKIIYLFFCISHFILDFPFCFFAALVPLQLDLNETAHLQYPFVS